MTAILPAAAPLPAADPPPSVRALRAALHGVWDGLVRFGAAMAGVCLEAGELPEHPHDTEGP